MNESTISPSDSFIITKEYKRFTEFCDACKRYQYIGLCYGKPGVGKTLSARYYARWDRIETLAQVRYEGVLTPQGDILDCDTAFCTIPVTPTPIQLEREVKANRTKLNFLVDDMRMLCHGASPTTLPTQPSNVVNLLLVDEVDRLRAPGLEYMRDVYDRSHLGLVLIGMPGIEKRLARYPQLYSRVGFVHHFRALSSEEVRFIIEQKWQQFGLQFNPTDFTDAEALNLIIQVTSGNFRLIQRLFSQIERIMLINELRHVTKDVVEAARAKLVIGATT